MESAAAAMRNIETRGGGTDLNGIGRAWLGMATVKHG